MTNKHKLQGYFLLIQKNEHYNMIMNVEQERELEE
jgi:hypothetical protein